MRSRSESRSRHWSGCAAGTSLTVHPAAAFAELASKAGAELVICNAEPTPYDELAAAVLREPLNEVLPALAAVPRTESVDSGS